ncbi:hypothetical protein CWATWH0003_0099 [Crocosphaera watsonii WH 0003]|uniref:Uncharacterized protein n=1 Tax=Crocosphaera watsonii WH 0003 TaxID=423471 RepID=G5IXU3_CROWT|nr:hypothetical protein CWATWH0003_0099 [Crocosphaera watsonii WH 0003]
MALPVTVKAKVELGNTEAINPTLTAKSEDLIKWDVDNFMILKIIDK